MNKALIIVDEAYIEFAEVESLINEITNYPNLVILRTLSKAYGLAGVRCGTVVADPLIIQLLKQVIAPYPIPRPVAQIINEQLTLENSKKMLAIVKEIIQQREIMSAFLQTLSFVKQIWQSQANFILLEVDNAKSLMTVCQSKGIVLRDRSNDYGLNNCVRITIGTPEENQFLMEVLKNA
jgi:histidinol-phosphate aminotransferase